MKKVWKLIPDFYLVEKYLLILVQISNTLPLKLNLRKCCSSSAFLVEVLEATQQRVHYKETDSAVYFFFSEWNIMAM